MKPSHCALPDNAGNRNRQQSLNPAALKQHRAKQTLAAEEVLAPHGSGRGRNPSKHEVHTGPALGWRQIFNAVGIILSRRGTFLSLKVPLVCAPTLTSVVCWISAHAMPCVRKTLGPRACLHCADVSNARLVLEAERLSSISCYSKAAMCSFR